MEEKGRVLKFGERRKATPKKPVATQSSEGRINALNELLETVLSGHGIEVDISLRLLSIELHLNSLRGAVNSNTIADHRARLKHEEYDALVEYARNSSSVQWGKSPAYYRALIDELRSRPKPPTT